MMYLDGWTYLFEFGNGLFIYAKGNERVGVDKQGKVKIAYKVGPDNNPRCEECLEQQVKEKGEQK